MMRPTLLLAFGLLVLSGLPGAHAQVAGITDPAGAAVTLHFHLMGFQDFPINTQPAQFGLYTETGSLGLAAATLTCVPNPAPTGPQPQEYHTYRGFSTPGYVEYGRLENGRPYIHPEREMGYAAKLDSGVPPILHWFLETTSGAHGPGGLPAVPLVVPNVVVQATLRASTEGVSVEDKAYDTGPIVAQGRSAPALLAADASQGVEHSMVEGRHIYGFTVPMDLAQPDIGERGFTLRIDVFLDNPACADPGGAGSAMPNLVQPYADPEHRPGITAAVQDPLRIQVLDPQFVGPDVVVHGRAQSVWGNHDVDEGNLSLQVDGPAGHQTLQPIALIQRFHEHGHHTDPVDIAWAFNRSAAPPGLYWFNFTVTNDQHTANATASAAVNLRPDVAYNATIPATAVQPPARAAAGFAFAPLAVALVAVAFARSTVRRRG